MNITADAVKQLRERTGAGMMDCKKALTDTDGNMEKAVDLLRQCHEVAARSAVPADLLRLNGELTDANGAIFDAANGFAGCIAGVHEVLRRQGLLDGTWCLDPHEALGPGQAAEIDRVCRAYPHLTDDEFVRENLGRWLAG